MSEEETIDPQRLQEIEFCISKLQATVKESAIPGQRHLDFTLIPVHEKQECDEAMTKIHKAIFDGIITMEDFQKRVGLLV